MLFFGAFRPQHDGAVFHRPSADTDGTQQQQQQQQQQCIVAPVPSAAGTQQQQQQQHIPLAQSSFGALRCVALRCVA